MFEQLRNLFNKKPEKPKSQSTKPKAKPALTARQQADARGEPYIAILSVDVDPQNINAGAFELDWNDKFVSNLVRAGYQQRADDTDAVIVDRWFQTVCRNVALETYEQGEADPFIREVRRRSLGDGRSEVS